MSMCRTAAVETVRKLMALHGIGIDELTATPALDLVQLLDDTWERLDALRGHGVISLVQLRREMKLPRDQFDQLIERQRVAGRYSLSGVEGRHGLSDQERAAAIREDDRLLLYVSRRP